jgi:multiple sugar transport system ATP-binding protein
MVFQNYALYPHMTVRQNLAFPLKMAKTGKQERETRVDAVASTLGLTPFLNQKPGNLSGGQRQRVAMGRAMVRKPDLFLLDEPLSNLDAELRMQIRTEIARLQSRLGTTTIYVTHDQVEAMTLGDRVAVLSAGKLHQIGPGQELYEHPANTFVAGFIGTPGMNLFRTELKELSAGQLRVKFGALELPVPAGSQGDGSSFGPYLGKPVIAGVRPESFSFADDSDDSQFEAKVAAVEALGHELLVYFQSPEPVVQHGSDVDEKQQSEEIESSMVARLSTKAIPEVGENVTLRIDSGNLRLFDEEGAAIGG